MSTNDMLHGSNSMNEDDYAAYKLDLLHRLQMSKSDTMGYVLPNAKTEPFEFTRAMHELNQAGNFAEYHPAIAPNHWRIKF